MNTSHSQSLFKKALLHIPGGVNSPVRAFKQVKSTPFFVDSAKGAYLVDVDGNSYLDFVNAWGANLLGHAHLEIMEPVKKALEKGASYGTPHPGEVELAELLTNIMPSLENIRLVNSGTEAAMGAVRLARGYTGKKKIIKFEGCYHGASDSLLVKAGSGALTFGIPDSAGIPETFAQETLVARYNDLSSVYQLFEAYPQEIAGIIVEPMAGNMNFIAPLPDFLPGLRKLCDQHNALLIFDEVMTGFRVALKGAQSLYGITPDITLLAKVIGGGFPLAAFGGRREIMQMLAPQGSVYQAGTLSGNPIATTASLATLKYLLKHPDIYQKLNHITETLLTEMSKKAQKWGIPFFSRFAGGMFGIFFTHDQSVDFYEQVQETDPTLFHHFFHGMLARGVYFAPSRFETNFISLAYTQTEIEQVINAIDIVFSQMRQK